MTTYAQARYNRLSHLIEESGFCLDELEVEGSTPCAVYRLESRPLLPAVVVYALDSTFRVVTTDWELDLHLDVPASVVRAALVVGAAALGLVSRDLPSHAGMGGGEIVYRLFMAAYGLLLPAYVWIAMIPTRDGHAGFAGERGRRKRMVWAAAVGIAAPMFWMGLIERQELWLAGRSALAPHRVA